MFPRQSAKHLRSHFGTHLRQRRLLVSGRCVSLDGLRDSKPVPRQDTLHNKTPLTNHPKLGGKFQNHGNELIHSVLVEKRRPAP